MNNIQDLPPADSPESVGITAGSVLRFLQRIDQERICMHGFLLVRRGRVAAEGYWRPYHRDSMHRMYSISKSFVSLAIGLMVDRGLLKLEDQVIAYFPDKLPDNLHPYLQQATIRDLLMMASPHSATSYKCTDQDWAWTFFNRPVNHPPGTLFMYDTSATVILNTIVERISGMPFLEYMRPLFLDAIGFSPHAWCIQTPEGTSWGGSGVICTLRDMAKVAFVCMRNGQWGNRQLISREYIAAATAKQIDNSIRDGQGYGYQIWRGKGNSFAFRGMGSQFAFCFPDQDFLFTCIADTQGLNPKKAADIEDIMWQELHNDLADNRLPEDPEGCSLLKQKIDELTILPQDGAVASSVMEKINGLCYRLQSNPMGIERMTLRFNGKEGLWEYRNAQGDNRLRFGLGRMVADKFPQKNYFGPRIGTAPGIQYDCLASAAWVDECTLNMLIYITDHYLGTLKISMAFKNNQIAISMTKAAEWFLDEYQGVAGGTAS